MALVEITVPSPGESITEVQIARWLKKDGDYVEKDEPVCEIDSDKATLTINSEHAGTIKLLAKEGDILKVGSVICKVDTSAKAPVQSKKEEVLAAAQPEPAAQQNKKAEAYTKGIPSVAAEKIMREKGLAASQVTPTGKGGRITKADVLKPSATPSKPVSGTRNERREPMSMLRKRVGERLLAVKQETAMLTTFNEVDMGAIMNIRKQYKEVFKEKYGVNLGFMSFFTKAICEALLDFPEVNASIDGGDIIYHDYCDIGIAVSAPKGLMVPVIRNAEAMSMDQIEQSVLELATRARDGKISIEEMTGGTFTITNGGVFGSMLSTPIINPPQSAILGMHNIVDRPVAINGKVEIRPIMYVALSYDHRIIDGRESVSFLVKVKQMLEEPVKLLFDGNDPVKALLGI